MIFGDSRNKDWGKDELLDCEKSQKLQTAMRISLIRQVSSLIKSSHWFTLSGGVTHK